MKASGQTRIVIIVSMNGARLMAEAMGEITREYGNVIDLKLYYLDEIQKRLIDEDTLPEDVADNLTTADIVWFDVRGDVPALKLIKDILIKSDNVVLGHSMVTCLGSGMVWLERDRPRLIRRIAAWMTKRMAQREGQRRAASPIMSRMRSMMKLMRLMGKLPLKFTRDMMARSTILEYWYGGGSDNIKNMLLYLARVYGGQKVKPRPPRESPEHGIYHPLTGEIFTTLDDYLKKYPLIKKQTVGMLLLSGSNLEDSVTGAGEIMKRLADRTNFIAVYSREFRFWKAMREFFFKDGQPIVDIVVSFLLFRMNGGPMGGDPTLTIKTLRELDCPVLNAPPMTLRQIKSWQESTEGLSPIEIVTHVTLPELDGCIEPILPCGYRESGFDRGIAAPVRAMAPIPDRLDRIAARVEKWLRLRRQDNSEKRLAIILYNYPPDESGIGSAGYLNTIESLDSLLKRLRQEGYNVGELPGDMKLDELFTSQGIVNSSAWLPTSMTAGNSPTAGSKPYVEWFNRLPRPTREKIIERWGEPPGDVLTAGSDFIIPGIRLGNIFIGLQPPRGGSHNDMEKSLEAYHDKTLPPHHQYLAFYRWLENDFGADAIIHFGTHGTLEFTEGKEVGMSAECFPDILIGNLPHLYVYMVSNPSEAIIAKRRSYATIVNHMSPAFTDSGLYDRLADLEDLIHEYNEAKSTDPSRARVLHEQIQEMAEEAHFEGSNVDEIYDELFTIRRSIIPKGLHTFGQNYDQESIIDFITFVLRYDRGEVKSLHRLLAECRGIDYDEMMRHPARIVDGKSCAQLSQDIEKQAKGVVAAALSNGDLIVPDSQNYPKELQTRLKTSLEFGISVARSLNESDEAGSLLRGLCGKYISPNIGGDPLRSPDVLPTGSNTYQFDPRLVPSQAAYSRGARIAEATLEYYYKLHGSYPESVGVILWAFETMNTRGETVGQILRYIGIEPVRGGPWDLRLRLIPVAELGRPRIDVVVNIGGIFRDTFPNLVKTLDEAFKLVSSQDESYQDNLVRKHYQETVEVMNEATGDKMLAQELARARIFGPSPSEYATSLRDIIRSRLWSSEEELGNAYLSDMQYAYTTNLHGHRAGDLFQARLSQVELTSQIRDNHNHEIIDLDHYFEFSGGLAKAVEVSSGQKPAILIADTTKEVIRTEEMGKAIHRGARARLLNPKWIEGMLEEGYNGAQHIQERVENVMGLSATTNEVASWVWDEIEDRYVLDEHVRKQLEKDNPWALRNMMERLLEANRRGYWQASDERIEQLRSIYLELEGLLEEDVKL